MMSLLTQMKKKNSDCSMKTNCVKSKRNSYLEPELHFLLHLIFETSFSVFTTNTSFYELKRRQVPLLEFQADPIYSHVYSDRTIAMTIKLMLSSVITE